MENWEQRLGFGNATLEHQTHLGAWKHQSRVPLISRPCRKTNFDTMVLMTRSHDLLLAVGYYNEVTLCVSTSRLWACSSTCTICITYSTIATHSLHMNLDLHGSQQPCRVSVPLNPTCWQSNWVTSKCLACHSLNATIFAILASIEINPVRIQHPRD